MSLLGRVPTPAVRLLDHWVDQGWLRPLDRQFAAFLAGQASDAGPLLLASAAWASHQLGRGHVCLDLGATLDDAGRALSLPAAALMPSDPQPGEAGPGPVELLRGVTLEHWRQALDHPVLVGHGPGSTPLVLDGNRLYLRRFWSYEQAVRQDIDARLDWPCDAALPESADALGHALRVLFPGRSGDSAPMPLDWQQVACALAARSHFAIVTGGPGTGKTTTVVRLLALLQHLALTASSGQQRLRIRLAAPTGKAAARLNASIAGAVKNLPLQGLYAPDTLRQAIPVDVVTVHRLLASRPDSRRFRHDAFNPLPLDVLVVDEASMLDLEMMARLVAALPRDARLVLLGDKDQLASVEAGSVLGDLCRRADEGHYTPRTRDWVRQVTGSAWGDDLNDNQGRPLDQAVTQLRVSHRFGADSGIGRLAAAVNRGDARAAARVLKAGLPDLQTMDGANPRALKSLVLHGGIDPPPGQGELWSQPGGPLPEGGYGLYLRSLRQSRPPLDADAEAFDHWAEAALLNLAQFQLLAAVREGPQGVDGLNRAVETWLRTAGLLDDPRGGWYMGRPVMVTRNDRALGLMNGDVGIALPAPMPGGGSVLRVAFAGSTGSTSAQKVHWVLPSRLRQVQTAFAITVHKSQGSEFGHAALVLPAQASPVLTRELVYTAITRARERFTLVTSPGGPAVLENAIGRRVDRVGGL
ncbi:MAG: exodeoxyribonuclease V subunit alpha [Burkholderiaceae bacterium]